MRALPVARKKRLIVQELPEELLVYDEERNQAHCLNQSAARIWKRCDGRTTVKAISLAVTKELATPIDEEAVWFALRQFGKDHLLEEPLAPPPELMLQGLNRRQMVRTLGLAAIVAVPLVTSIVAPTPAQAATCSATGVNCTSSAQCCSGLCNAGTCA